MKYPIQVITVTEIGNIFKSYGSFAELHEKMRQQTELNLEVDRLEELCVAARGTLDDAMVAREKVGRKFQELKQDLFEKEQCICILTLLLAQFHFAFFFCGS